MIMRPPLPSNKTYEFITVLLPMKMFLGTKKITFLKKETFFPTLPNICFIT